jgi:hypothetical protein
MLEKNKPFLQRYFPGLLDSLQQDEPLSLFDEVKVVTGKRGLPTLVITNGEKSHYIHSQYNPQQEAERWANAAPVPNQGIVCLIGWGLGYHAIEWIKRYGKSTEAIIIIEPEPQFLKESLSTTDLSQLMNASRVEIVCGCQPKKIQASLMKFVDVFLACDLHILLPPFAEYYPPAVLHSIKTELQRFYETKQRMLNHMAEMGDVCQTHIIQNIPAMSRSAFPSHLKDQFKGEPAVIVAAGPSLDTNIHQLKGIENNAWIFAVDTSTRVLLQHGIQPHFVVTKDPTELNANHLRNLPIPKNTVIAFDPQISPQALENKSSPLLCMPNRNHMFQTYLSGLELNKNDELPLSNNVALAAFNLAVHAGCSPVIFVGLDLCFSSGASHASGTVLQSNVAISQDKLSMKYTRGDATDSVATILVEGIDGQWHPTTPNFLDAIRLLEQLIQQSGTQCIDASEGGAKIKSTLHLTLQETIDSFCSSPIAPSKLQSLPIPERDRKHLCDSIKGIVSHFEYCIRTATQTINTISKLSNEELKAAKAIIEEDNKVYHLLQSALERLLVEIHQPGYWDTATNDNAPLQEKYKQYFTVIHQTCIKFTDLYQHIEQSLDYENTLSES